MNAKNTAILCLIAASLMWAIETILGKIALSESNDFVQTTFVRSALIALVGLLFVFSTNRHALRVPVDKLSKIAYLSVAATLAADTLFYFALANSPVVNATLIPHLQPVFIILFGFFVLKEDRLVRNDYAGIFLMALAAALVTSQTPENLFALRIGSFEDLVLLAAAVIWATTTIVVRKYLTSVNTGALIFYRFSMASIVFAAFLAFNGTSFISTPTQILVGIAGGFGFIFYYTGLKRIKAALAGALESFTPLFAALLGFLVLEETVTPMQLVGIATLFAGVFFLSKKEK